METISSNKNTYIELNVVSNLYSEPDKAGKQKLIKKNIHTKISVYVDDIQAHEEVFDNSGKLLTKSCRIHHKNLGPLIIKHTYKQILEIKNTSNIHNTQPTIGFKNGNNKSR